MPDTNKMASQPETDAIHARPAENGGAQKENRAEDGDDRNDLAALALGLADDKGVQVFCDELRNPCIVLPDDRLEPVWPLYHQRVKAWFSDLMQAEKQVFVTDRDLLPVLRVLEGRAWKAARRRPADEPTWRQIEREPVALALITFANEHGGFEGRTRDLFVKLHEPHIQARLQMAALAHKFPVNTQVFSKRVNVKAVKDALAVIGLDVSVEHKDDGSHCSVKLRRPLFAQEPDGIYVSPSATVSGKNSGQAKKMDAADATDAMASRLNEHEHEALLGKLRAIREGQ